MSDWEFKFWIWEHTRVLLEESGRTREETRRAAMSREHATWQPPVDVFETTAAYWLVVALPGVDPARVEIEIEDRHLAIRGARSLGEICQDATVHRLEIPHGPFERRLALPPGRVELGERRFVNGCLALELRKSK